MPEKKIKILYVAWFLVAVILVYAGIHRKKETHLFRGIAESREVLVNTENPVEIAGVHVLPGQAVGRGELLVELHRPELTRKINGISHEIRELKMQREIKVQEIEAQIAQLESERQGVAADIAHRIEQLRSRRALNRRLAEGLSSIRPPAPEPAGKEAKSFLSLKIDALEKERELALTGIDLRIQQLRDTRKAAGKPLGVHIQSLERELAMLDDEQRRLKICSDFEGIIGSVHFKTGEKVSPFAPILTLHPKAPSFIKGFIPEDAYNQVKVGQRVRVQSLTTAKSHAEGVIVGVGSRIVEYPVRLRLRPELKSWGREVQIRIPEDNALLLGEKVLVSGGSTKPAEAFAALASLPDESRAASPLEAL